MKSNYKRLGDYIEAVDERNTNSEIQLSQGISNNKYFQDPKQVADNSANDNIVRHGYFAYNRATTRNGEKISIAYREGPDCTVSSAYQVFRIKDENKLNPHYLWMWYKRPIFDRYARFKSHGSAHEFFEFSEMCDVMLPIPSIERQREIVAEYETISKRIKNNEQFIATLETTAQTLYRKMFVEGIDKENLPEGWRMGELRDICECFDKIRRPLAGYERINMKKNYPYYGASSLMDYVEDYLYDGSYILMGEDGSVITENNTPIIQYVTGKFWVNNHAHVLKGINGFDENLLYCSLKETKINEFVTGGVQAKINQENMLLIPVIIPNAEDIHSITRELKPIFRMLLNKQGENEKLTELQSLLLAKMGK